MQKKTAIDIGQLLIQKSFAVFNLTYKIDLICLSYIDHGKSKWLGFSFAFVKKGHDWR